MRNSKARMSEETEDARAEILRRGEDAAERIVGVRAGGVGADPEHAHGAIERLEDGPAAERGFDRREDVGRVDRERTAGDVLRLELARGPAAVLRLGARAGREGGALAVSETMLDRDEIPDAIEGITAPREPRHLLGSEPQLRDRRLVERQLVPGLVLHGGGGGV
jgi:hypothetical protein